MAELAFLCDDSSGSVLDELKLMYLERRSDYLERVKVVQSRCYKGVR